MPTVPTREVITTGDRRTTVDRTFSPLEGVTSNESLQVIDIFHGSISPDNFKSADGAPLRVLAGTSAKIDVSKRSHEDMGFWHRSADFTEIIVCIRGALRWETEVGTHVLLPGQLLVIPRGVAHRSALTEQSADENVLIELKVTGDLEFVGPNASLVR